MSMWCLMVSHGQTRFDIKIRLCFCLKINSFEINMEVGDIVQCRVTQLTDFGAICDIYNHEDKTGLILLSTYPLQANNIINRKSVKIGTLILGQVLKIQNNDVDIKFIKKQSI